MNDTFLDDVRLQSSVTSMMRRIVDMQLLKVVFFDIGDTLVSGGSWVDGGRETLTALKATGLRLGLISNTGDLTREQVQEHLPDNFRFDEFEDDLVLLSSEVGIQKPKLEIFLLATQRAGVSPWQCLFVGESLVESLAAQAAGMHAARIVGGPEDLATVARFWHASD